MLVLLFSWVEKFGAFFGDQVLMPLQQKVIDTFGGTWLFWLMIAVSFLHRLFPAIYLQKQLSRFVAFKKFWKYSKESWTV